ncbi:RloB domain-containing protein [Altericroceibacterium endophyticum]|uniref:RloB domain-containing protein n=1 Tax=Altericroceibacterium endophyticum TaxID=1808508 RepID=UPI001367ABCA
MLIVTEGKKTEPSYFNHLIRELGLTTAKVRIAGDGGSAPVSVLDTAKEYLDEDDDYEQIYLVFDRDNHASYDEALTRVQGLSERRSFGSKTILAAPSVPCFEVWYALHIADSCRPYQGTQRASPAKELITALEKQQINGRAIFQNYDKSDCSAFFQEISQYRDDAKRRSARILREAENRGDQTYHENPSTRVHLIVEALERLAQADEPS